MVENVEIGHRLRDGFRTMFQYERLGWRFRDSGARRKIMTMRGSWVSIAYGPYSLQRASASKRLVAAMGTDREAFDNVD